MAGCQGRNSQLSDHGRMTTIARKVLPLRQLFFVRHVGLSEICRQFSDNLHIVFDGSRAGRTALAILYSRF